MSCLVLCPNSPSAVPNQMDLASQEWVKSSYGSAVKHAFAARAIGVVRLALTPLSVLFGIYNVAASIVNKISTFSGYYSASKIATIVLKIISLAICILLWSILLPTLSIISPEIFIQKLQLQKYAYNFEIEYAITTTKTDFEKLSNLRQRVQSIPIFGRFSLDLDIDQFQSETEDLFRQRAQKKNMESNYGLPADNNMFAICLRDAFLNNITRQLDTLLQIGEITAAEHGSFIQQLTGNAPSLVQQALIQAIPAIIIPRSDTKVSMGKILFEKLKEASNVLYEMADRFTPDEIEGMYPAPYNAVIGLAVINMIAEAKLEPEDALTIALGTETVTLDKETEDKDMQKLRPRLIELKQLLDMISPAALKVLKDHICSPDDGNAARKAIQQGIEDRLIALQEEGADPNNDTPAKQERRAFNLVNEVVNTMNRRIIQTKYLPDNQTLPWAEAFLKQP